MQRRIGFGPDLVGAFRRELRGGWRWDLMRGLRGKRWPLFKGGERAEQGLLSRIARGGCDSSSCPKRTEVGDGPDLWVPPGSETGRGTRSSAAAARWRAQLTGRSSVGRDSGPRRKERREGEEGSRQWGKEIKLGRGSCARWAEGKDWGKGSGPSGRFP